MFNWSLVSGSKVWGCTNVMPTFYCMGGCFLGSEMLPVWIPLLSLCSAFFFCSVWWTIFIGFVEWVHRDPDSRTLLVYSVTATSKAKAGFPLSSRSSVCSISRLCVVSAVRSTVTADSCSSGGQTVPACSQTYSMYNKEDEIVCNIWNTWQHLRLKGRCLGRRLMQFYRTVNEQSVCFVCVQLCR